MTRAATQDERFDRERDYRKTAMTHREIAAELTRLEREIKETVARSQAACKEAMRVIEGIMDELGVPMAKEKSDA
jgi:predicted transcriptional regulator